VFTLVSTLYLKAPTFALNETRFQEHICVGPTKDKTYENLHHYKHVAFGTSVCVCVCVFWKMAVRLDSRYLQ
jgi:hypothetical protein